jgi:sporulation protein YlmC with PRC-barrel domain
MMEKTDVKSADILGMDLTGLDGVKLGVVRECFIDPALGQVTFLIIERSSFMGGSGKYHPVPWTSVRHDPIAKAFQAQLSKDQFKASPSYDRAQLAADGYGWDDQSAKYFDTLLRPDPAIAET